MVSLQRHVPNIRVQPCLLAIRESYYYTNLVQALIVLCGRLNYVWIHQGGKQAALSAPTYIDYVMTSIQNLIDDEKIFPTKSSMCVNYIF
jgi:Mob1/phocein family